MQLRTSQPVISLQKNSACNDNEDRFMLDYLLQSVHGIIEFPPSVQSQQPNMLPLGDQQVHAGVLGFNGGLSCWHIHGLRGRPFSCESKKNTFNMQPGRIDWQWHQSRCCEMRMLHHPAVTQHWDRWLGSCSTRGVFEIRTSSSSFAKHRDLRLALGFHSSLPLVCLSDFVNIWLLPGHFLHECLQRKETSVLSSLVHGHSESISVLYYQYRFDKSRKSQQIHSNQYFNQQIYSPGVLL